MYTNFTSYEYEYFKMICDRQPEKKNSGLNGIQTHDRSSLNFFFQGAFSTS